SGYDAPLPPPQCEQTVMKVRDGPVPRSGLADQILALLHCRRRLMFLDIARRFSDCTWQMLFDASCGCGSSNGSNWSRISGTMKCSFCPVSLPTQTILAHPRSAGSASTNRGCPYNGIAVFLLFLSLVALGCARTSAPLDLSSL